MSGLEWLPAALATDPWLEVVEEPGWRDRWERDGELRDPAHPAVVLHHDGSPAGASPGSLEWITSALDAGRPAAQLWVDYEGRPHIIGNGYASHAGTVLPGMPGNRDSIGVEIDHTIGEPWPARQLEGVRRTAAAILRYTGQGVDRLTMHKVIASPPGRKPDPDGLDLTTERAAVAALLAGTPPTRPTTPVEDDVALSTDDLERISQIAYDNARRAIQRELGSQAMNDPNASLNAGVMRRINRNFLDQLVPAVVAAVRSALRAMGLGK